MSRSRTKPAADTDDRQRQKCERDDLETASSFPSAAARFDTVVRIREGASRDFLEKAVRYAGARRGSVWLSPDCSRPSRTGGRVDEPQVVLDLLNMIRSDVCTSHSRGASHVIWRKWNGGLAVYQRSCGRNGENSQIPAGRLQARGKLRVRLLEVLCSFIVGKPAHGSQQIPLRHEHRDRTRDHAAVLCTLLERLKKSVDLPFVFKRSQCGLGADRRKDQEAVIVLKFPKYLCLELYFEQCFLGGVHGPPGQFPTDVWKHEPIGGPVRGEIQRHHLQFIEWRGLRPGTLNEGSTGSVEVLVSRLVTGADVVFLSGNSRFRPDP